MNRPHGFPASLVAALGAVAVAGCAAPALIPDTPRIVKAFPIAPFEQYEECTPMRVGDRLDYRFEAQMPVTFGIRYMHGSMSVMPITREDVEQSSGIFRASIEARYCLLWQAGQRGAVIDIRLRLLRDDAR